MAKRRKFKMPGRKFKMPECSNAQYLKALKQLTKDAHEMFSTRRLPAHLRVAIKSHARSLARTRCQLAKEGK